MAMIVETKTLQKKASINQSTMKAMLFFFFFAGKTVYYEFFLHNQTVNKWFYMEVLRHFMGSASVSYTHLDVYKRQILNTQAYITNKF